MTTRHEWDALSADEQFEYMQLTECENVDLRGVLNELPECPDHGFCLPYFRDWIRQQQRKPLSSTKDALLMFDRQLRQGNE